MTSRPTPTMEELFGPGIKAGPCAFGFRVVKDDAYNHEIRKHPEQCWWLRQIPCHEGGRIGRARAHFYTHGKTNLGFSGVGLRLRRKLLSIPEVSRGPCGDEEFSVTFPLSAFWKVAEVVQPIKAKVLSPEHLAALKAGRDRREIGGAHDTNTPVFEPNFNERYGNGLRDIAPDQPRETGGA